MFMNHIYAELTVQHYADKASILFLVISHIFHIKVQFPHLFRAALVSVGGPTLY